MTPTPNLETQAIRKVYPGTVALDGVSIAFHGGQVHAVIGKNGAGKSSLIRILSGATQPTNGRILVQGIETRLYSPRDAFNKGIATVYQELSLVPGLSIGENIFLGRMPTRFGGLLVDKRAIVRHASEFLQNLGVDMDARQEVAGLGVAERQVLEIAKAMSWNPSVLLLDEPTSALAHDETEHLFRLIRRFSEKGVAVIYISHRLQELQDIADCVSVLRDGRLIGTVPIANASAETITHMMFGELVPTGRPADHTTADKPVLEVRHLTRGNRVRDVSLHLYPGEVLGIAGMVGSGRTELLRAISGADGFDSGEIIVSGRPVRKPTPARMKRLGISLLPENRKEQSLVLPLSMRENLCLASLDRVSRGGVLWKGRQQRVVEKYVRELRISVANPEASITILSGGNQQKVVVGKWLNTDPRILLLDEPTRGIDIQAKQQIFQIIRNLSDQGIASIVVSSELEEIIALCSRILVMRRGQIVEELPGEGVSAKDLFHRCMASTTMAISQT